MKFLRSMAQKNAPRGDQSVEFTCDKFRYDLENDEYIYPQEKHLPCHQVWGRQHRRYFDKEACASCLKQPECCKLNKLGFKTINRSHYADSLDRNDKLMKNNKILYHKRQELVEHPFGTIKRTINGYYFLLRTLQKVSAETALMFLGYNIRRVFNVLGFDNMMKKLAQV